MRKKKALEISDAVFSHHSALCHQSLVRVKWMIEREGSI